MTFTHLNELTQRESALSDSITVIEMKITDLRTSSDVAAEIGPLKYISKITGKTMDTIVNWLIIALIIVFDPLAIMLLIVANKELNTNNTNTITQNIEVTEQVIKPEPPVKKKSEPQILSYWNRLRNERNAKYKK